MKKRKKVCVVCGVSEVDGGWVSGRGYNADRGYLLVACVAKGSVGFPLCRSSYLTVDLRVHTLHICTLQFVHPGNNASFGRELLA